MLYLLAGHIRDTSNRQGEVEPQPNETNYSDGDFDANEDEDDDDDDVSSNEDLSVFMEYATGKDTTQLLQQSTSGGFMTSTLHKPSVCSSNENNTILSSQRTEEEQDNSKKSGHSETQRNQAPPASEAKFKCGFCPFSADLRVKVRMHCSKKHAGRELLVIEPTAPNSIETHSHDNIMQVNCSELKGTKFEADLVKAGVSKLNLASLFPSTYDTKRTTGGKKHRLDFTLESEISHTDTVIAPPCDGVKLTIPFKKVDETSVINKPPSAISKSTDVNNKFKKPVDPVLHYKVTDKKKDINQIQKQTQQSPNFLFDASMGTSNSANSENISAISAMKNRSDCDDHSTEQSAVDLLNPGLEVNTLSTSATNGKEIVVEPLQVTENENCHMKENSDDLTAATGNTRDETNENKCGLQIIKLSENENCHMKENSNGLTASLVNTRDETSENKCGLQINDVKSLADGDDTVHGSVDHTANIRKDNTKSDRELTIVLEGSNAAYEGVYVTKMLDNFDQLPLTTNEILSNDRESGRLEGQESISIPPLHEDSESVHLTSMENIECKDDLKRHLSGVVNDNYKSDTVNVEGESDTNVVMENASDSDQVKSKANADGKEAVTIQTLRADTDIDFAPHRDDVNIREETKTQSDDLIVSDRESRFVNTEKKLPTNESKDNDDAGNDSTNVYCSNGAINVEEESNNDQNIRSAVIHKTLPNGTPVVLEVETEDEQQTKENSMDLDDIMGEQSLNNSDN